MTELEEAIKDVIEMARLQAEVNHMGTIQGLFRALHRLKKAEENNV